MVGFERGGGKSARGVGVCAICQARVLVNKRGCCDGCDLRVLSFPGLKDRYETERDDLLDYSTTMRSPLWTDDLSDVSYTPRVREFRYKGFGKYGGYDSDRY